MKFSNPQSRFHQARNWAIGLCAAALIPLLAACPGPLDSKFTSGDCKDKRKREELVACLGGTGVGGMNGGGTGGMPASCDAPTKVFNNNQKYGCASSVACHGANSPYIDLTKPPADVLIGKPSKTDSSTCKDMALVKTTTPASGVLFDRMTGTSCGPVMPPVIGPVAADDVECVRTWLNGMLTQMSQNAADFDSTDDPAPGANE